MQYWLARHRYNIVHPFNPILMQLAEDTPRSVQRTFQLHDSETICKLFLDACRQYDLGKMSESQLAQRCMVIHDDAENLGLTDPLANWES